MRFTPQTRSLEWMLRRPIAHRGLHDAAQGRIENTRSAFAAAIKHNYAIECDVQLSSDGEAVVFHDETLDRVMEDSGPVNGLSVVQLKAAAFRGSPDRIQTLAELLEQVAGQVPLIVEIKSHWDDDDRLARRACEIVAEYDGPLAVMSFDPCVLRTVRSVAPQLIRGIVADRVFDPYYASLSIGQRIEMRQFTHVDATMPHYVSFDMNGLPFAPVQQIRAQGFPVITWTVTSDQAARRALRYCDQITFEGYLPG